MLRNEHIIATYSIFWKFPTATERAAVIPIEAELGRVAWQADDNTFWLLIGLEPTWLEITTGLNANSLGSAGIIVVPTITYDSPNVEIAADGMYSVYANASYQGGTIPIQPATDTFELTTEGTTYYIYAEYTVGGGELKITTDRADIHSALCAPICRVIRTGTTFHTTYYGTVGFGQIERLNEMVEEVIGYRVASGLTMSVTGTRNIAITEGQVWLGAARSVLDAIDTSVGGTIIHLRWDGAAWVVSTDAQLNNTQYQTSGGVSTLTSNRYAINWIWRGIESQPHIYCLLGSGDYKEEEALDSGPPTPPTWVTDHAVLLGRIMFVKSSNTVAYLQTVNELGYVFTGAVRHNDTTDKQGGTAGEYYHFTAAEHSALLALIA